MTEIDPPNEALDADTKKHTEGNAFLTNHKGVGYWVDHLLGE